MMITLLVGSLILAAIPAAIFLINTWVFSSPCHVESPAVRPQISVLIPARNEATNIRETVAAVAASDDIDCEIVVLDDHSDDGTAEIIRDLAADDERIRLVAGKPLPSGWCGKQFACQQLGEAAQHDRLLFIDADVRLSPSAISSSVAFLQSRRVDLVSGFPRQQTETSGERLLIPLIHFILLGFLPLPLMRWTSLVGFGAGCGQFFLVRKAAWVAAGGHAAIRSSLHDGIQLPRTFRRNGFRTDVFNAGEIACCRMYTSFRDTLFGLKKNATEGIAAAGAIVPFTVLLIGGQVLPPLLLVVLVVQRLGWGADVSELQWLIAFAATTLSYAPRLAATIWFRQSWLGAVLHPCGIAVLVAIQWWAIAERLIGRKSIWKGRAYGSV